MTKRRSHRVSTVHIRPERGITSIIIMIIITIVIRGREKGRRK